MEEHLLTREVNINKNEPGEPAVQIENGEYAWGFRVAEN